MSEPTIVTFSEACALDQQIIDIEVKKYRPSSYVSPPLLRNASMILVVGNKETSRNAVDVGTKFRLTNVSNITIFYNKGGKSSSLICSPPESDISEIELREQTVFDFMKENDEVGEFSMSERLQRSVVASGDKYNPLRTVRAIFNDNAMIMNGDNRVVLEKVFGPPKVLGTGLKLYKSGPKDRFDIDFTWTGSYTSGGGETTLSCGNTIFVNRIIKK